MYPAVAVSVPISLFIWVCGLKKNSMSAVAKRFVKIAEINAVFNLPPFAFKKNDLNFFVLYFGVCVFVCIICVHLCGHMWRPDGNMVEGEN